MTTRHSEHGRSFPRGLVLGLTMAETVILIVFVLLLALTALLGREAERRRDAERDLQRFEQIRLLLVESGLDQNPEEALSLLQARAQDRRDAENWRELVRDIASEVPDPSPAAFASRLREARHALDLYDAHRALDETLRRRGREPTRQAFEELVRDAEYWRELGGDDRTTLAAALDRANEQVARLEAQARGRGTDHPSCWYDDDSTVAYLFDVALMETGYVIEPAQAPQHASKRSALPLAAVRTGTTLNAQQFLEQTRPVFDWSVANDCRFFVRAFDLTAADQKDLYKDRMRVLESRFYKNANPSGPLPFAGLDVAAASERPRP